MLTSLRNLVRYRLRGVPDPRKLASDGLRVGRNVYIAPGVVIDPWHCWLVSIGDGSVLAPGVHILAHDPSTKAHLGHTVIGEVVIGRRVFVGAHAMIMPDVRIGDDAIIGAGSVVRADVPAGVVAAGNPLQVLDSTKDYVARQKELFKRRPRFGPEYRFESGLTDEMKAELREAVREGAAFID